MTPDELSAALGSLTPGQMKALNEAVGTGGGDESVEGRVQHFVYYADRPKLEEIYILRLNQIAGLYLRTEADKLAHAAIESTEAEKRAADAAERSASSAQSSAESARESVRESKAARRMSTLAVVTAVAALLLQAWQVGGCLTR